MIKSLLSNRWFLAFTIALVVLVVLLIATPVVSKQLARQWLLEHGATQVRF